ncbi:hypothetical protein [Lentzea sp. NPDC092896]|uniref:hypothetical protein n=1 Tax=Lentzea sp. NPDC092896 TaxID=3364127 RepID=UPI0038057C76
MKLDVPDADAWMFDLIAQDDVLRSRALARHRDLVARESGLSYGSDGERTIYWYLTAHWYREPWGTITLDQWPFVALYLRWEGRFPDEWRAAAGWSPWSGKESVLERLGRKGVPAEARPEAADLLVDVLHRPYRCKDWMYALLVRHVADAEFRDRLTTLAGADDPLVVLRARFLLHLADRPEHNVTRKTWLRWLESLN